MTSSWIWVNTGPVVPSANKPLPGPMLTNHQWSVVAFTWGQFHRKYSRYKSLISIKNYWFKIVATSSHRGICVNTQDLFNLVSFIGSNIWFLTVLQYVALQPAFCSNNKGQSAHHIENITVGYLNKNTEKCWPRLLWLTLHALQTSLTHWGLVTPYGIGDLGQHWFR